MPAVLPALQAATPERVIAALNSDSRVEAVLGGGSMVHGGFEKREAGLVARGVRRIENVQGAARRLAVTVPIYDTASVRAALEASASLYVELRRTAPPPTPVANMPQALLAFIAAGS